MEFMKMIVTNIYLCWAIISVLLISNIIFIIMYLNQKKRKQIKEEFVEIEKNNEEESSELNNIIDKMQKDMELRPEQVVANFEEEQEKNAIISYQELLECVKNNKIQVIEDDQGDVDFVQELNEEIKEEPMTRAYDDSKSHLDVIDDINDVKRFTGSEIISPVYGRMNSNGYPVVENYSHSNSLKVGENTMDLEPVSEQIKKNEDFLKNLVEFRNNL